MAKLLIKAVTEAFSSQPSRYQVGWQMPTTSIKAEPSIHYIEKDQVSLSGKEHDVYIGRCQEGNELFMVLAEAVNVEYQ